MNVKPIYALQYDRFTVKIQKYDVYCSMFFGCNFFLVLSHLTHIRITFSLYAHRE